MEMKTFDEKNFCGIREFERGNLLGWIQMLEKTYDACEAIVGKKVNEDPILLPISHSTANAQIEVTIDLKGKFMPALSGIIPKDGEDKITIIPVTEDSASRSNGAVRMHYVTNFAMLQEIIRYTQMRTRQNTIMITLIV